MSDKQSYRKIAYFICSLLAFICALQWKSGNFVKKGMRIRMVTREDWGAKPPKMAVPLKTPVPIVVVYPETATELCYDKEECIQTMQNLQQTHFDKKYPDIQYNFLVSVDGRIYEGRGWKTQSVKMRYHPKLEGKYISIAYIGNFEECIPPYRMTLLLDEFLKYAVANKYVDPNYRRAYMDYETHTLEFEDERGELPV